MLMLQNQSVLSIFLSCTPAWLHVSSVHVCSYVATSLQRKKQRALWWHRYTLPVLLECQLATLWSSWEVADLWSPAPQQLLYISPLLPLLLNVTTLNYFVVIWYALIGKHQILVLELMQCSGVITFFTAEAWLWQTICCNMVYTNMQ